MLMVFCFLAAATAAAAFSLLLVLCLLGSSSSSFFCLGGVCILILSTQPRARALALGDRRRVGGAPSSPRRHVTRDRRGDTLRAP